jgi:hypothetical protein
VVSLLIIVRRKNAHPRQIGQPVLPEVYIWMSWYYFFFHLCSNSCQKDP